MSTQDEARLKVTKCVGGDLNGPFFQRAVPSGHRAVISAHGTRQ